jgi:hypothetical protein
LEAAVGKAAKALGGGRKKPLHARAGVTEGGQFIGRDSILHGIVKLLTGGGIKGGAAAPGSVTRDPRMDFKRPRLLAQARKRGVPVKRGAPQRAVVAALRQDSAAEQARAKANFDVLVRGGHRGTDPGARRPAAPPAKAGGGGRFAAVDERMDAALDRFGRGSGPADPLKAFRTAAMRRAAKRHGVTADPAGMSRGGLREGLLGDARRRIDPVVPGAERSTFSRQIEALHDQQAKALLDNWDDVGWLHGLDGIALMNGQDQAVLERLALARGVSSQTDRGKLQFALLIDANRFADEKAPGRGRLGAGIIPASLAKLPLVWDHRGDGPAAGGPLSASHGGRVDASGLAEALDRWRQGGTRSDPFESFQTGAMKALAKDRGLALPRKPGRTELGIALMSDERRQVRRARDKAANPPAGVMPGAPIIGDESKYHRDISDVRDIADGVAEGVAKKKMANQGMVGETWIETLKNGMRVIHKWSKRDWAGADAKTQADAEQLASQLGRAIRAPVPKVYRHNDVEIYMGFIDGAKTGDEVGHGPYGGGMPTHIANSDGARRIGILDLLANNFDRHSGNYMVDREGRVWGIDHGLAWAPAGLAGQGRGEPPSGSLTVFGEHFVQRGGIFGGNEWKQNDFTQAEWAEMRQKVEALRPDFDRLGRGHWHEFALARLDALAAHASDAPRQKAPGAPRLPAFGGVTGSVTASFRRRKAGRRAAAALAQPTPSKLARGRRLPEGVGPQTAGMAAIVAIKRKPNAQAVGILRGQPVAALREMALALNMNRGDARGMKREELIRAIEAKLRE